ncbi:site-specific integrase [Intestinimonas massiliensis]|nr:tyrosine-type recombinase/integrase [Intestinimonas massiliensis (ex Afouda et al. 2020)]MCQ4805600.1 site-specific integrase [Intestinimonas massiliensis (ex Afouda et al. 2020)]
MTRVFIWKNNSPQEWEEISFSAFSKARRNGCFTGRFFVETVKMFRDEDDRIIMECSRKDFEKYQQEDRHSRYLQEHEKSRSIFPASHVGDRDGTEEGYQDIVKRKSKYSVVYDYTDENGKRRQRWETFSTNAEAKKRKKQIEYEQDSGTFFIPTAKTLNDLLDEYMSIYGVNTWAMSTYESRRGLARNYITPIIGDMLLSDITPRMMDKYYRDLLSVKTVSVNNRKPTSEYLTPHTVREIHKLLRSAFNQAVRWELISRNPVLNATLPKEEHKERDIWTAETLSKAMEVCDDPILSLALNLAFSCSLRIGEMLGLTWDCIDIAPQSIENGSAYIFVNKELQRVTRGALDDLSDKGVIKKFPPCIASTHTALVLKEPKTKTSIRRVYLPKTVAYMLVERKKEIDELMDLFGDEYIDNNLVFCSSNGRPMESQVINRAFNKLIKENGLPHVVFHSLRHSSITYKLKLNGGDMKSVQGDSGHAQVKMVADVYSHIIDEDRCINAQRLEEAFYSSKTPDPVEDTEPKTADTAVTESDAAKILELLKNPETAALLKQLAKAL